MSQNNGSSGVNTKVFTTKQEADRYADNNPMSRSGEKPTVHAARTRTLSARAALAAMVAAQTIPADKAATPEGILGILTDAIRAALQNPGPIDGKGRYVVAFVASHNAAGASQTLLSSLGVSIGAPDAVQADPKDLLAAQMGISRAQLENLLAGVPAGTIAPTPAAAPAATPVATAETVSATPKKK